MKIGIYGYGNLGRAVETVTESLSGVDLAAIFTRRDPDSVRARTPHVYPREMAEKFMSGIDCMLICTGSHNDTRADARDMARHFNTVDAFDIHAEIAEHKSTLGEIASAHSHTSIVSVGWDPGVISLFRALFSAVMPRAAVNTFWGRGVSQGHSEAVRAIRGVRRAVQYTHPRPDAMTAARGGARLSDTERHRRECYVVADSSEHSRIEREILAMPHYFRDYDTEVHFISEEEFIRDHVCMPHAGTCIAQGQSGVYDEHSARAELSLTLDSNPEFTALVMIAYARACYTMSSMGIHGAHTVLDVPLSYLVSDMSKL